jgi:hypothetical protein
MYAIVTGVFAAFAAVLFNARAKRYHESLKQENKNHIKNNGRMAYGFALKTAK